MATQRKVGNALRASERCAQLYIDRQSTELTAAEVAASIGVGERTFYRHFPHKRDTIRPLLDEAARVMAASIRDTTDRPLQESLLTAFREAFGGARDEQTRRLFPLLLQDEGMRAGLLHAVHDGRATLRPAIADRLGIPDDSVHARVAASLFVAAIFTALESMAQDASDPMEAFSEALAVAVGNPLQTNNGKETTP
jgi:AcrR family transcriptional regulator